MPTRRIQRGPATGGQPPGFQNAPNWNELYVDGATDALMVGTGIGGPTNPATPITRAPQVYTFATLPVVLEGSFAIISDASVNTWGTVIAGGGGNRVLGYFNGAAWTVAAK